MAIPLLFKTTIFELTEDNKIFRNRKIFAEWPVFENNYNALIKKVTENSYENICNVMKLCEDVMGRLEIIFDEEGNKVVHIPDIIFANKQNIDWKAVEVYLKRYVGEIVEMTESKDIIYIGKDFPDEFTGSKYTRKTKGARAKAKANAVCGIREMIEIATNKTFHENHKAKHNSDAGNGWYYYTTRFALPIYDNERKTDYYNIYTGCLVVNCALSGKMYLYDLVDIKKEASNPLKTTR